MTIEHLGNLSTFDFFESYYRKNKPVIIGDIVTQWPALAKWSPSYLKTILQNDIVQIMASRDSDPRFEVNSDNHKTDVRLFDYIDSVCMTNGNNSYLVANNGFMHTPNGHRLLEDIVIDQRYLDSAKTHGSTFFWFGPSGTVTPFHHDVVNILFCQVYGRKKFVLISPDQKHLMYNSIGVFSDVDYHNPDLNKYPLYEDTQKIEFILNPGEAIYLPINWWHCVMSLDVSMSMSFTGFCQS